MPSAAKTLHLLKTIRGLAINGCLCIFLLFSSASFASTTLYHLVSEQELGSLTKNNVYTPLSVAKEGYIHFSKLSLIPHYANELYKDKGIAVLFLLKVTFSDDDENLKWIGDNPDYYKGLDLSMVEEKTQLFRDKDQNWVLTK